MAKALTSNLGADQDHGNHMDDIYRPDRFLRNHLLNRQPLHNRTISPVAVEDTGRQRLKPSLRSFFSARIAHFDIPAREGSSGKSKIQTHEANQSQCAKNVCATSVPGTQEAARLEADGVRSSV